MCVFLKRKVDLSPREPQPRKDPRKNIPRGVATDVRHDAQLDHDPAAQPSSSSSRLEALRSMESNPVPSTSLQGNPRGHHERIPWGVTNVTVSSSRALDPDSPAPT